MKVYTVSEITNEIRNAIGNKFPNPVWVEGEITDYRPAQSGHLYFSLKDEFALIRCVLWRENRTLLTVNLANGIKIKAYGEISIWAKRGEYNLIVERVLPIGIGDLQIKFELLKKKLFEQGLFDESHKKPLPYFPERIGVVTSLDGAALRDIINISKRRYPGIEIIIRPTLVQGDGAAYDIATAIDEFNKYNKVDLLIVGRGGGSIEDLWSFNEEIVARAIYNSKIPIISAVGHEIDYTIADFVADVRAPTPSAAAEIAIKDTKKLSEFIDVIAKRINYSMDKKINQLKNTIGAIEKSYGIKRLKDLIYGYRQTIDNLIYKLTTYFKHPIEQKKAEVEFLSKKLTPLMSNLLKENNQKLSFIESKLNTLNPKNTLKRGYTICYKLPEKTIVKSKDLIKKQDIVELEFFDGKRQCEVKDG